MQCGMAPLKLHPLGKNDVSVPARHKHVQNEWCQTPSCSAMFSLDTLSIYLEYFPAKGWHIARIFLEAKWLEIIPYVGNVSEYFSKTTFNYSGIFLKYSKGVWTVGGMIGAPHIEMAASSSNKRVSPAEMMVLTNHTWEWTWFTQLIVVEITS